MTMTRQQRYLTQALAHVDAVKDSSTREVCDIYGGLCHEVPVLVRTCGLCQTVAFIAEKAGRNITDREKAHELMRLHIAAVLGVSEDKLLDTIRSAAMLDYMRYTRAVLAAGIYYKRFAGSILKVPSAQSIDDAEGE